MTKESYLQSLEALLKKHLSKSEISDILRDYGEYFDDGRRQNKTDTEISAKLGDPEIIAQQFIEEIGNENRAENKTEKAIHTIKEGTEKAFSTIKENTEKALISLKKEKEQKREDDTEHTKRNSHDILYPFQKGIKSIFSATKSICLFFLFAFLQFFFTIFVYGFCICSSLFLIFCGIFGLFCLGICMTLFPAILSLSLVFAIIAVLALSILLILLALLILKVNIQVIQHYTKIRKTKREAI